MNYKIAEFDNDYDSLIRTFYETFDTREKADEWCIKNSWSGSDYMVLKEIPDEE
jgi:hypothetical protein